MAVLKDSVNRRRLMGVLGLSGAGAIAAAVGPTTFGMSRGALAAAPEARHGAAAPATAGKEELSVEEMDAMHAQGLKVFVEGTAKTAGLGGQPLEFEMDGDVKVFRLTAGAIQWEFAPRQFADAFAYNGVVPGPESRVTEGDKVRIVVTNESLPQSTAVHFHGVLTPNAMDGVPFITQPPIKPGETFIYEFPIREGNAGSHMYHSHHNAADQVSRGLLRAFIIEPKDPSTRPAFDKEYTIAINDGPIGGFTLNGKRFPATSPLTRRRANGSSSAT